MMKYNPKLTDNIKGILERLVESNHKDERRELAHEALKILYSEFNACLKCGHINTSGKFCSECGHELAKDPTLMTQPNDNIIKTDYLIWKERGMLEPTVLSIADTQDEAYMVAQRQLNLGIKCDVIKRTLERVKLF